MEEKGIHVLMVGGRRAGKTSMLAGLFEAMLSDGVQSLVKVEDVTPESQHESLLGKIRELKESLQTSAGKVIMDDKTGTDKFHPYTLKLSLPETGHSTQITFTDVNGEYYTNNIDNEDPQQYKEKRDCLIEEVKKSDVILIAIDTPFLMTGNTVQNIRANCIDDIQGLLTDLKKEDKAKLVVFVPMKCERWVKNHLIDDVVAQVEQAYATIITNLKSPMVEMVILPVSTVGSMEFREFLPAYLYTGGRFPAACSLINQESKLRFADGGTKEISKEDYAKISDDPRAVFKGTHIERPNTWFEVTSPVYAPKNCEQLAYHILRYTLNRTLDAIEIQNEQRHHNGGLFWKILLATAAIVTGAAFLYIAAALAFLFGGKLGDISTDELKALVSKLSTEGYIKDSGDGIKTIQQYKRLKAKA